MQSPAPLTDAGQLPCSGRENLQAHSCQQLWIRCRTRPPGQSTSGHCPIQHQHPEKAQTTAPERPKTNRVGLITDIDMHMHRHAYAQKKAHHMARPSLGASSLLLLTTRCTEPERQQKTRHSSINSARTLLGQLQQQFLVVPDEVATTKSSSEAGLGQSTTGGQADPALARGPYADNEGDDATHSMLSANTSPAPAAWIYLANRHKQQAKPHYLASSSSRSSSFLESGGRKATSLQPAANSCSMAVWLALSRVNRLCCITRSMERAKEAE